MLPRRRSLQKRWRTPALILLVVALYALTRLKHGQQAVSPVQNAPLPLERTLVSIGPPRTYHIEGSNGSFVWAFVLARAPAGKFYIEILSYAAGTRGNQAHSYSRSPESEEVRMQCRYGSTIVPAESVLEGEHPRVLLHRCKVPSNKLNAALRTFTVELTRSGQPTVSNIVELQALGPPSRESSSKGPSDDLEICLSPTYGKLDKKALLEWRLHHARLGVQAVHWYFRPELPELADFVQRINALLGVRDTVRVAPILADSTVAQVRKLYQSGAYVDQVPYHMDCLLRQAGRTDPPWLAILDHDEFLLPSPVNSQASEAIPAFLKSRNKTTASSCVRRTEFRGPAITQVAESSTAKHRLPYLGSFSRGVKSEYNVKCIHKADAVELIFTHWPERFVPDQVRQDVEWLGEDDESPLRIAHLREVDRYMKPFPKETRVSPDLRDWVASVGLQVEELAQQL